MEKKKIILIGSIVVIISAIVISVLILSNKNEEPEYTIDGIVLPENKSILKDTTVENLKITDISLLTRDGISSYSSKVSNNTENDIQINKLYVVFYENEKEIKVLALKNSIIKSNNETYIRISSETDLSKTTKIEYIIETKDKTE